MIQTAQSNSRFQSAIVICLLSMALAVVLGAFGAHLLEDRLSEHYMAIYRTANFYHFIQTLGWLAMILIALHFNWTTLKWQNIFFGLGLILFCGSLYILSFNEYWNVPALRKLGAITPIGGLLFIIGWVSAASRFRKI